MAQTDRLTGLVGNAGMKVPTRVATTANITLSGEQTIDGVAAVTDNRVLVKDQTDGTENGIWVVDTGGWARSKDFDGSYDIVCGSLIRANEGTVNGEAIFAVTSSDPITIGTTDLVFTRQAPIVTLSRDYQVATAGQTVFNLGLAYRQGVNALQMFVNGLRQLVLVDFAETSSTSVTTTYPLEAGDEVEFVAGQEVAAPFVIDASQIQFTPSGVGGVVSNVQDKLRQLRTREDYDTDAHRLTNLVAWNLGYGEDVTAWTATTPQIMDIRVGSAAAPDTVQSPIFKVSRTVQMSSSGLSGDASDHAAGILSVVSGTVSNEVQTVGVMGYARSASTHGPGGGDACGAYGVGRVTGAGTGLGLGGFFCGRRDTDTGYAGAVEFMCANYTATPGTYNSTGASTTRAAWLNAAGDSDSGVGLAISNPFGRQFEVGVGFTAQVSGGKTGGVSVSSIRDDCTSTVSLDIRGTHTGGALNIAQGAGSINIQATATAGQLVRITGNHTGSTTARGVFLGGTIQSDVTASYHGFNTSMGTQAAAFTLTNLRHYYANQGTIGAGSAVTNQYGFAAESSLTGATNNYGFYSNIAAAAARWGFFDNGGANNAFSGNVRIGSTVAPTVALDVTGAALISSTLGVTGTLSANTITVLSGTTATVFNATATTVNAFGAASVALNIGNAAAPATFAGGITIADAKNIVVNTGTGTKIGTGTTQKLAFWNSTPIVQPSSTGETVGFTAGGGTAVTDSSTFTGNAGATAYRLSDIVKHLKNAGLIAA